MNKITLKGFANDLETVQAPTKWVARKTAVAWANGPTIRLEMLGGASVKSIANRFNVSAPTIYKILAANTPLHSFYRSELSSIRKDRNELAQRLVAAESALTDAQNDLANAKLGEASAFARLNDPSIANKWKDEAHKEYMMRTEAESDRAAAEAQIEMMAERLAECRGRGFWARLFNR
jgi:transposase-like protein